MTTAGSIPSPVPQTSACRGLHAALYTLSCIPCEGPTMLRNQLYGISSMYPTERVQPTRAGFGLVFKASLVE